MHEKIKEIVDMLDLSSYRPQCWDQGNSCKWTTHKNNSVEIFISYSEKVYGSLSVFITCSKSGYEVNWIGVEITRHKLLKLQNAFFVLSGIELNIVKEIENV